MNNYILNGQKIELNMEMYMFMYVGGTELLADKTLSHHVFFSLLWENWKWIFFKKLLKLFFQIKHNFWLNFSFAVLYN